MTKTEENLIAKGYQKKGVYNLKSVAQTKQKAYQHKNFNAQLVKDTPAKTWKLYVKRS